MPADLTPFGFTPTESLVYHALLKLGPATGYAVAREARLARANAYSALEGLVSRGAATRGPGRPAQYRPVDPPSLLAIVAGAQGEALDRLAQSLKRPAVPAEPLVREVTGARGTGNVIMQLVARAETGVVGVIAAELWRPTLPAWRHAAARAALTVRLAGPADDPDGLSAGVVDAAAPTLLVVDDAHFVTAAGAGDAMRGLWGGHPLVLNLARHALEGGLRPA
jgi:sugar-specific transcriptional regulator TrmB